MFVPTTYASKNYAWPKQDRPQQRLQNDTYIGGESDGSVRMHTGTVWPGIEQGMYGGFSTTSVAILWM